MIKTKTKTWNLIKGRLSRQDVETPTNTRGKSWRAASPPGRCCGQSRVITATPTPSHLPLIPLAIAPPSQASVPSKCCNHWPGEECLVVPVASGVDDAGYKRRTWQSRQMAWCTGPASCSRSRPSCALSWRFSWCPQTWGTARHRRWCCPVGLSLPWLQGRHLHWDASLKTPPEQRKESGCHPFDLQSPAKTEADRTRSYHFHVTLWDHSHLVTLSDRLPVSWFSPVANTFQMSYQRFDLKTCMKFHYACCRPPFFLLSIEKCMANRDGASGKPVFESGYTTGQSLRRQYPHPS